MSNECGYRCVNEERIRTLEQSHTETRIYVKEIREDVQEIKADVKKSVPENISVWQPIVVKLIEVLGTSIAVIGAIAGALKIMGKG